MALNQDKQLASIKLARIYRRMNKELDKKLADLDLKRGQHSTLLAVSDLSNTSYTDLAKRLEVDKAAVTRSVVSLEKKGYLQVTFAKGSQKMRVIKLTDSGNELVESIKQAMMSVEAWLESELSDNLISALKNERL